LHFFFDQEKKEKKEKKKAISLIYIILGTAATSFKLGFNIMIAFIICGSRGQSLQQSTLKVFRYISQKIDFVKI